MNNLRQTHKTNWLFKENNTLISLDICRLTISLSSGTDRHQDAMEMSESFDVFLSSKSTITNYLISYKDFQNHSEEIVASVKFYSSDDYFDTLTPEDLINFEKYNPEKAIYLKENFYHLINFTDKVELIEKFNQRSVKVLTSLVILLILIPGIWSLYNLKALYFLVPILFFCVFLSSLIIKTRKYKPKFGKADIIEIYQSKSTMSNKNIVPLVFMAKVKSHKLFGFKNGFIDTNNHTDIEEISYQISSKLYTYLKDKESFRFITRGNNEIFEVL